MFLRVPTRTRCSTHTTHQAEAFRVGFQVRGIETVYSQPSCLVGIVGFEPTQHVATALQAASALQL